MLKLKLEYSTRNLIWSTYWQSETETERETEPGASRVANKTV